MSIFICWTHCLNNNKLVYNTLITVQSQSCIKTKETFALLNVASDQWEAYMAAAF